MSEKSLIPLEHPWTFWAHHKDAKAGTEYSQARTALSTFDTVEDFWRVWNNVPLPSTYFFNKKGAVCKAGEHFVDGWSLFHANVLPEWEHPANSSGTTVTFQGAFTDASLDNCWQDLVLAAIGEMLSEYVVGVKALVRNGKMRLEAWLTQGCNPYAVQMIVSGILYEHHVTKSQSFISARTPENVHAPFGGGKRTSTNLTSAVLAYPYSPLSQRALDDMVDDAPFTVDAAPCLNPSNLVSSTQAPLFCSDKAVTPKEEKVLDSPVPCPTTPELGESKDVPAVALQAIKQEKVEERVEVELASDKNDTETDQQPQESRERRQKNRENKVTHVSLSRNGSNGKSTDTTGSAAKAQKRDSRSRRK